MHQHLVCLDPGTTSNRGPGDFRAISNIGNSLDINYQESKADLNNEKSRRKARLLCNSYLIVEVNLGDSFFTR